MMDFKNEQLQLDSDRMLVGCDEVGRGPLAGPVVAAWVLVPRKFLDTPEDWMAEVKDSKKLSAVKREYVAKKVQEKFLWGIGQASHLEIDELNVHHATLLSMQRAGDDFISKLGQKNLVIYIDGKFKMPDLDFPQETLVGGDGKIFSIAAASILAKTYRDELMVKLDGEFPGYGFAKHKGYGTLFHREQITKLGLTPVHRLTFCKRLL